MEMNRAFPLLVLCVTLPCAAAGTRADLSRRDLQIRQQQDALNLNLQQSIRAPHSDLSAADARRLDQLNLNQRLQQQQLEQQQLQRDELLRRQADTLPPGVADARIRAQRNVYEQERTLQLQQFELDRQRFLQSVPREPLQTPAGATLRIP
jgi:hypothetical protein